MAAAWLAMHGVHRGLPPPLSTHASLMVPLDSPSAFTFGVAT